MPSASTKVSTNSETECSTMSGWSAICVTLDSDRKLGDDRIHRGFQILAERQNVGAILHRDAEAERGLTAFADDEAGRILVAALDGRDVAKPEHPAVGLHRHGGDGVDTGECAGDPQIDAVGRGVHRPAGRDRVLLGDAVENLLRRDTECGELCVAQLNEDLFGLLAYQVDLVDVWDTQQPLANVLGAGLELGEAQAVGGQHVDGRDRRRRTRR